MGWRDWIRSRFRKKETVTTKDIAPSKVESTGGAIVGDTPSGYVEQGPTPTEGTTTIRYSRTRGSGGGSSSRTITTPSGETYEQTAEQAQKGENLPTPNTTQEARRLEPSSTTTNQIEKPIEQERLEPRESTLTTTDLPAEQRQGYIYSDPVSQETQTTQPTSRWGKVTKFLLGTNYFTSPSTQSQNVQTFKFVTDPAPFGRVPIGGTLVPEEDFAELPKSQQRLLFFAQPETILASTSYPSPEPKANVRLYGIKETTKDGKTYTAIKFRSSTGESGEALGVSVKTGKYGVQTDVAGVKTSSSGLKTTRFTSTQDSVVATYGDDITTQFGLGRTYQFDKNIISGVTSKSAGASQTFGPVDVSVGRTTTYLGQVRSTGVVFDLSKLKFVPLSDKAGTLLPPTTISPTTTTTDFASRLATEAGIRSAITPTTSQISGISGVVSGTALSQQTTPTPQPTLRMLPIQERPTPTTTTINIPLTSVDTDIRVTPRTSISPRSTNIPAQVPTTVPTTVVVPKLVINQLQSTRLTPRTGTPNIVTDITPSFPFKIPIPSFGSIGFGGRSAKIPTRQTFRYTPDYTSLVIGRRGKQGESIFGSQTYAGFESRPITESWGKLLGTTLGIGTKKKKKKRR